MQSDDSENGSGKKKRFFGVIFRDIFDTKNSKRPTNKKCLTKGKDNLSGCDSGWLFL